MGAARPMVDAAGMPAGYTAVPPSASFRMMGRTMAASYVNYHVRSDDPAAVAAAAKPLVQGRAYVTPAAGGWVTLYDEVSERQDAYEIGRVAGELSVAMASAVFAFVVNADTLFVYYLFENGDLSDEYNSSPGPTDVRAGVDPAAWFAGRPEVLLRYCPAGTRAETIAGALAREDVLHSSTGFGSAVRAEQRLRPLAGALRIDIARATRGFPDVDRKPAVIAEAATYTKLDGRPIKNPFRGPVPPRLPPRG